MKVCPNCGKELTDGCVYCRICGSRLDGSSVGDFSTEVKNLFMDDEGYYYLYTHNGHQQVIKSDSVDEIKSKVLKCRFPWFSGEAKSKTQEKVVSKPHEKSLFLRISESASQMATTNSSKSHASFNNAKKQVKRQPAHVKETSTLKFPKPDHLKETPKDPPKPVLVPDELIPREFGVIGLYRDEYDGRQQWVFKTNDTRYPIHNDRLDKLKEEVLSRECHWEVVDEDLQSGAYELDDELKKNRDAEILAKRKQSNISLKDKIQIKHEIAESKRISRNPQFENLDRMKW